MRPIRFHALPPIERRTAPCRSAKDHTTGQSLACVSRGVRLVIVGALMNHEGSPIGVEKPATASIEGNVLGCDLHLEPPLCGTSRFGRSPACGPAGLSL